MIFEFSINQTSLQGDKNILNLLYHWLSFSWGGCVDEASDIRASCQGYESGNGRGAGGGQSWGLIYEYEEKYFY